MESPGVILPPKSQTNAGGQDAGGQQSLLNPELVAWVETVARLMHPQIVHWCTGTEDEAERIFELMLRDGSVEKLDALLHPNSYYVRGDVEDVERSADRTFICSLNEDDAGPGNNWMDPVYMRELMAQLFSGCMQGRVMYVVPYLLGPPGSPAARVGVQVTDSPYVVANLRLLNRIGRVALDHFGNQADFVKCIHSVGTMDPEHRYICQFPEENLIISVNTNYGSDAMLSRKCHALRLASVQARHEGWLAEHMTVFGVTSPDGVRTFMAGAFPASCGKTNLAMLLPPDADLAKGWKVEVIGDDIAWMHFGDDGRLYAVNPEAGFFGVATGTGSESNPTVMDTLRSNAIFTNVAMTEERSVWWEGLDGDVPESCVDWTGKRWEPECGRPAAHPNSRFTVPATNCPLLSDEWDSPQGVPISAIIFGGRRSTTMPLIYEAFNWQHGTYIGATLSSEMPTTVAGAVGPLRFDPMAMQQFCGYHMADYWQHWLNMGKRQDADMPRVYHVNWFRKDWGDRYLWPGFRENMRVLKWIVDRTRGRSDARETAIGMIPEPQSLELSDFGWTSEFIDELLAVKTDEWYKEVDRREEFLSRFSSKLPQELLVENDALRKRIQNAHLYSRYKQH
jgi:phosphoenolpyruvate carboxykinase (GTP)